MNISHLISFRIDWFHLLAVQGTLKSLLQHHSSKASILQHSAFFIVQLSHPYMTTGKTIALNRQIFVSKVMSLLFNMLSRLVIAILARSKHLLISWLQSPSALILELKKIKSVTVSIVSSYIYYQVMGPHVMILGFWMLSFRPAFSLSLSSRGSLVPLLFLVVSSTYVRVLIFLQAILIPACASSNPEFLMMYPAAAAAKLLQSFLTLCDPIDSSPPGFLIHGILQARILEWVAIFFSRGSSWTRDLIKVSRIAGRFFNLWASRETICRVHHEKCWNERNTSCNQDCLEKYQ